MRETFLIFGAPDITDSDLEAVIDTFRSGWIGTGPQAAELETRFAAYTGSPHGVALNSCTAALHLAMLASGIQPGEEVITTPMTFCATANAILHAGAVPVFADIHPRTGLIDPAEIERRITPNTRAIVPVHLHGRPCDMDAISRIARENNLLVIEDCAHAIETLYHGRHAGTCGDAGCFSFYVTKNVVGIDGGMVVTASRPLAEQVKILALHGMTSDAWKRFSDEGYKHYEVVSLGYKYNLPDVHAACALSQLGRVETNLSHRARLWDYYNKAFAGSPCVLPEPAAPHTRHARHLYTLLLDLDALTIERDRFMRELHARNIGCGVHYLSLHLHTYYREKYAFTAESYPHALWHSQRTISLPLSTGMTEKDCDDVIEAVLDIFNAFQR